MVLTARYSSQLLWGFLDAEAMLASCKSEACGTCSLLQLCAWTWQSCSVWPHAAADVLLSCFQRLAACTASHSISDNLPTMHLIPSTSKQARAFKACTASHSTFKMLSSLKHT